MPTDFGGELRPYGVLFTDRGIYRPGDEVQLKGIVRRETATGNALPGEQVVKVSFRSPSGDELRSESVMLSSYGTLSSRFQVPSGAELGSYAVSVSGLGREHFAEQSLEVSEYRPVELRVAASADRPAYVRGETAQLELKPRLFLSEAGGGRDFRRRQRFASAKRGFKCGRRRVSTDASSYYDDLEEVSAAGELRTKRASSIAGGWECGRRSSTPSRPSGTELLRIDAEATDGSRRSGASSGSAVVLPAAFYVGIKTAGDSFVEAPGAVAPQVLAFDSSGRRLAGKRVALELYERRYTYARESAGDDEYRGLSRPVDRHVARCELTTGVEPVSCSLSVPAAGYYLIVARAKADRGRL